MRPKASRRNVCAVALGALITIGCPRRFDPRAEALSAQNSDDSGRYRQALAALDEGDAARAKELTAPLCPAAAVPAPGPAKGGVTEGACYVLGVASHRLGDFALSGTLLRPFSDRMATGTDATELHGILADLARREGATREALLSYERFSRGGFARPAEQAYARAAARRLIAMLPAEEQAGWLRRFDLEALLTAPAPAMSAVGIIVPLSGKDRALGERVLRGALIGLSLFGPAKAPGLELRVRDSGSSPARAQAAATELGTSGVLALIGSPVRVEQAEIAQAAAALSLPVLDTSSGEVTAGEGAVLHLVHSGAARVRALVQHGATQGIGTLAVIAPATAYGAAMTRAAKEAAAQTGGKVRILGELSFPEGATTFTALSQKLLSLRPEALLLPVSVSQLELVSAQLASSSVTATQNVPSGAKQTETPPVRLVLSTAEGLGERLLKNAGRYLQGAVLAPLSVGALPTDDAALSEAGERYRKLLGEEPGALDALGFDAARLILTACEAEGRKGRPCADKELRGGLLTTRISGATGPMSFSPDGGRAGSPLLVRVEGTALRIVPPQKIN